MEDGTTCSASHGQRLQKITRFITGDDEIVDDVFRNFGLTPANDLIPINLEGHRLRGEKLITVWGLLLSDLAKLFTFFSTVLFH